MLLASLQQAEGPMWERSTTSACFRYYYQKCFTVLIRFIIKAVTVNCIEQQIIGGIIIAVTAMAGLQQVVNAVNVGEGTDSSA